MTIACATPYIVNHLATPCRARSHQDVLYVKFMAIFSIYNWIELSSTLPVKPGSSKLSRSSRPRIYFRHLDCCFVVRVDHMLTLFFIATLLFEYHSVLSVLRLMLLFQDVYFLPVALFFFFFNYPLSSTSFLYLPGALLFI